MTNEQSVSGLKLTHLIVFYSKKRDEIIEVFCTELEASKAIEAWTMWRPVPVPNSSLESRATALVNPQRIETISRKSDD